APAAAAAARSHTGVVAGPYAALRAALRQAGVVQVTRSDELFHVGETLASQPSVPPHEGVAVLSDGGGQGALAVDALEEAGVRPAALSQATRRALRRLLGPAAAVDGPVDLAGAADADPRVFARALDLLCGDPEVGAVLVVGLFGGYGLRFDASLSPAEEAAAGAMAAVATGTGTALVVHSMYAADAPAPLLRLREAGVPVVESLEVACRSVAALVERGHHEAGRPWRPAPLPPGSDAGPPAVLGEPEARELMEASGVPIVAATLCPDADAAAAAARAAGGPVAVKAVAEGLVHKSDVGAVALGVEGEASVREAFERVTRAARAKEGAAGGGRGALVSPMLPPPLLELLVGARRDEGLGTVLTIGAGGTWVEVLEDVSLRVLPVDRSDVRAMLSELRVAPLLRGARGRPPADEDAIVDAVLALVRLMEAQGEVIEADLNPLFAGTEGAVAVDARVVVRRRKGPG
ncbi:MAG: acetate--CoA ligase family protein, partial [Gemmatimonadetes bacterium]|nr:acetate--CoA ligase family protein [Gemmatimonadota bacterium]